MPHFNGIILPENAAFFIKCRRLENVYKGVKKWQKSIIEEIDLPQVEQEVAVG